MKIYKFQSWENKLLKLNIKASDFNSALCVASAFMDKPAYVGEL